MWTDIRQKLFSVIVHVCIHWIILSIIKTLRNRSIDMGKNTSTTKKSPKKILGVDDTDTLLPSNDINDMICHICNISVPRSCMSKHEKSTRHTQCLKIANISLERITKNLNQNINAYEKCQLDKNICYCKTCSVVVEKYCFESHTKTYEHVNSLKHDEKLKELVTLFLNEPDCCFIITNDKSPLNEPVVVEVNESGEIKADETIKEIKTVNPADIQSRYIKTNGKIIKAKKAKVTKSDAATLQSTSGIKQTVNSNICPDRPIKANANVNVPTKLEAPTLQSTSIIEQSSNSNFTILNNNIVKENEEADSHHVLKTTENEFKLITPSEVYDVIKNTNDDKEILKWKLNLNGFIKLINKTNPHPNNFRIIHDSFVEITAENGDKIVIDFEKINTYPLNSSDSVVCKVCWTLISGQSLVHMTSEKHMLGLVEPIKDRNCIRKLTGVFSGLSHCLLCDKVMEQSQITAHINENAHRNNVKKGQVEEEIEEITCLRTVEQVNNAVKLVYDPNIIINNETDAKASADERKVHCEVCNEDMVEDHAMDHELSREHQLETKKLNSNDTSCHSQLQSLPDPKALYCQLCCTTVPNHTHNASEHVNGAQHKSKYLKMLQENKIYNFGAGFKCSLCYTIFTKETVLDHIYSVGHEVKFKTLLEPPRMIMGSSGSCNICNVRVSANNMAAHVESEEHRLQVETITDDDYYVCPICHVAFPYSLERIKKHNKTKQHSHNVEIYKTENFLTIDNGMCVCNACGYHMTEYDIYAHVSTYQHAVHSIAYCMNYCSY